MIAFESTSLFAARSTLRFIRDIQAAEIERSLCLLAIFSPQLGRERARIGQSFAKSAERFTLLQRINRFRRENHELIDTASQSLAALAMIAFESTSLFAARSMLRFIRDI